MSINKVLELYDLMAKGYEELRFGTNQARVYREIIEFIKGCKTPEEVAEKINGSKYYMAPGIALIKDELISATFSYNGGSSGGGSGGGGYTPSNTSYTFKDGTSTTWTQGAAKGLTIHCGRSFQPLYWYPHKRHATTPQ